MKRRFYAFCIIWFISGYLYSQCNFVPLDNNDFNLPSYNRSDCSIVREDTAGQLFVASIEFPFAIPVVHKFNGTVWEKLGTIASNNCTHLSMAISKSGRPYIAFRDGVNGFKLSVLTYSGGVWNYVGSPGFSGVSVWDLDLKLDKNDDPVVAFQDQTSSKGSAMKFNGSTWVYIGPQYISTNYMTFVSLALDSSDVPFVAYSDGTGWPSLNATVKKFDGVNWTLVGPQKFSASQADKIQLKFDRHDSLYIVYSDYFYSGNLTVKKFVQPSWKTIGAPGFTISSDVGNDLTFDTSGVPHILTSLLPVSKPNIMRFNGISWNNVGNPATASQKGASNGSFIIDKHNRFVLAYNDQNRHYKSAVVRFNGTSWDYLGDRGFSTGIVGDNALTLAVDKYGVPYACFSDSLNGYHATVMKYSNNNWTYVGQPGFTSGTVDNLHMKFDTLNVPYLCFSDGAAGMKQSVMKYDGTAWVYVGSPGFSPQQSYISRLTFYNNKPYLICAGQFNKEIYHFNGSAWTTTLNASSFFLGFNSDLKLTFDTMGHPFMLVRNPGGDIFLGWHTGVYWKVVGMSPVGEGHYIDMDIDNAGTPFVVFSNLDSAGKITVKKLNSSGWSSLTTNCVSRGTGRHVSIRFIKDELYISYIDQAVGNRVVLLKFNGQKWISAASDSIVSAGASSFARFDADTSGNFYILYKSTEAYAKKIRIENTLHISSAPSLCTGRSTTLNVSGAPSYTWSNSSITTSIVVTPTTTTTYYANSHDSNNCSLAVGKTISVLEVPNLNIIGGGNICSGSSTTLSASGADSYTWNANIVSSSVAITPTASTVYTVSASVSTLICQNTQTIPITIVSNPTIQPICTPSIACKFDTVFISASGALSYSINGQPLVSNSTSLQVLFPYTYTISGKDANGCIDTKPLVVGMNALPTLMVIGNSAICLGDSLSLKVIGALTYTWNNGSNANAIIVKPQNTTSVSVLGRDYNCVGTKSVLIVVNPLPVLTLQCSDSVVCAGESVTLSAFGADSYTWVSNENFSNAEIVIEPESTTTYTVLGRNTDGCMGEATYNIVVDPCTGIPTYYEQLSCTFFPNPTKGLLTVNSPAGTELRLLDQTGRLLFETILYNGREVLDLQNYSNGLYFIRCRIDQEQQYFKIIKEN